MIKKLTKSELSVLLTQRNKTKYIYDLNVLHNVGNPNLAVTDMYGYCVDNDIIIVSIYCFNGCEVYFEISDFNNLQYIYEEIESTVMKYNEVLVPTSKLKVEIANILKNEGYINGYKIESTDEGSMMTIELKYGAKKERVITGLKRISKPGLRVYAKCEDIPRVLNGLGIAIISTSKGLMVDREARKANLGGEVLAYIW